MRIALLGKGKTGSKVLEFAQDVEVFDSSNVPTYDKLIKHDVIISFLPGEAFEALIPVLLETKKPVVTGSTGFKWPVNFDKTLQEKNVSWIFATNFSLGVVVLKQLIERLHQVDGLFKEKTLSIHEVHHTKKLDAPSGTALSMKEWLQEPCEITSERTGDVVGLHTLTLETPGEILRLEHEAKDRRLFAEGAVWAANYITKNNMKPGLHAFQKVVEGHLSL
ncbi:4-hydroxy-tetrahydrodipicolinate reductase [Peredibacter starrii]|uniref:4-hydroxy-tetrahydrodipicolinate reductase n=1 Tax=Peredibacter starrii TaxID=28202 RepID=A0AAX4HJN5_9BACT|nr:dihydrodipicolinate reductase C-terminal domain-containing protein [Peredibacter starrii]WPU63420.1 dihydrodipicolinate reductase C-terminal domain-containing protein [Peredibacter starrii]